MKQLLVLVAGLACFAVSADTTVVPGPWDLYRGTSKVSTHGTEQACVAAADALNVLRSYTCRTRTAVTVTADAPPPPPPAAPAPPPAPSDNGTVLTWPAVTTDINGAPISGVTYSVEQRVDGGAYAVVASGITATSWSITGLAPGVYQWRVYARSGSLASGPSPVWSKTIAAPPPPPPPTTGAPYDLGAVPFAYSWPTAPTTTRTVQATTLAQVNTAASQNGARIDLAAGNYSGNLTISGSDVDLRCNRATIRGGLLTVGNAFTTTRPARVSLTGCTFLDGGFLLQPVNDVMFSDIYIDNLASASPEGIHNLTGVSGNVAQGWNRMAWINSTIRLRNSDPSGGWAFYTSPMARGNGNLILANVKVQSSGGQNNRFMGITNFIVVDSVFNPDGLSTNGMRIHESTTNVFMRDSWVRGLWKMDPTNGSDSGPQVVNGTFLRIAHYDQNWGGLAVTGQSPNTGTVRDSNFYSGSGGSAPYIAPFAGSGNRLLPWDGATVPDYSGVGARR